MWYLGNMGWGGVYVVGYRAYKAVRWVEGVVSKSVEGNWIVVGEMKCIKAYGVGWVVTIKNNVGRRTGHSESG